MLRIVVLIGAVASGLAAAAPASAQFYLKPHDFTGQPIRGDEPGIGQPMPGATDAELRAAVVWSLRAALNVAALQCQFEPTLLTVPNYNSVLKDHDGEFDNAMATLTKYFTRTGKGKGAGQSGIDQFGTRTYSSFATVVAQYGFCQTASNVGREAVFTPRGHFGDLALARMREIRNSLTQHYGEQQFQRYVVVVPPAYPRLDAICWDKKGEWVAKKCGPLNWPPAGSAIAAR